MNNDITEQKSWWKMNWKWIIPVLGMILISIIAFFSFGVDSVATNFAQAYADTELYDQALNKVRSDPGVAEVLGEIQPIDNMAILEGQVTYSNDDKTVNSTIRIVGTEGKAMMDIAADRINGEWNYSKINVRIKNPPEKRQTIEVYPAE